MHDDTLLAAWDHDGVKSPITVIGGLDASGDYAVSQMESGAFVVRLSDDDRSLLRELIDVLRNREA